jgi:hypothetical protein
MLRVELANTAQEAAKNNFWLTKMLRLFINMLERFLSFFLSKYRNHRIVVWLF